MPEPYKPDDYWQRRLTRAFDLKGVGHQSFGHRYNEILYRRKEEVLTAALGELPLSGTQVFDVGVGTGYFTEWFRKRGATVSGVDIAEVAIEHARERFGDGFRVADIGAKDFDGAPPVDIVSMWDVAYHIVDDAAHARAMGHVTALLKPGGRFVMTDWLGAPQDRAVAAHVRGRTLGTYERLFAPLGVRLEGAHPMFHWLNRPVLKGFDEMLAPLYLRLDRGRTKLSTRNLSLAIWKRERA